MISSRTGMALTALALTGAAHAEEPFFMGLGHLPGGPWNDSEAIAVSADGGAVTGRSNSVLGAEAFRWTLESGMLGLGDLPGGGSFSMAGDISADGTTIVGISYSEASAKIHKNSYEAFRWRRETGMIPLGVVQDQFSTTATAVSGDGSVVVGNTLVQRPWRWTADEGMADLLIPKPEYAQAEAWGISIDGRRIVGDIVSANFGETQAVIWDGEDVLPLGDLEGGAVHSRALAASEDGSVVVGTGDADHDGLNLRDEAFRWTEAGMVGLGDLPGSTFFSTAVAVSADGSVVAGMSFSDAGNMPYIWDAHFGMRELLAVLADEHGIDFGQWTSFSLTDMSADGRTFVGVAMNPAGEREGWIASMGALDDCYPDFTGDGVLDLFDFLAYVNAFNAELDEADCTGDELLDLFDFLCFVNAFNEGC
jgi:uncharacterized membrane protein